MKNIIKNIAVLATAAFLVATPSFAADNYSPASIGAHQAVAVNPNTGVQVYPPSYVQVYGFNGSLTNPPSATGTNFVIVPGPQLLFIQANSNVNFPHITNQAPGSYYRQRVIVKGNTNDQTVTYPASWVWPTNTFDTNHIIGKIGTLQSNTFLELDIQSVGTNVLIKGQTLR